MKSWVKDAAGIVSIAFVVSIFFFRFFWPVPQLLVTPDFGSSDAWHASFPMKYALWEALQENRLPTWQPLMGGGYPLIAEGQVGAFFLPNLILFHLPDPVLAYNLALATTVLLAGISMYVFLRVFGFSALTSFFGGITFAFSGPMMGHLQHITLLQGMSLLPLILALTHLMLTRGAWPWLFLWSLTLSQQLFSGFPQGALITLVAATGYTIWHSVHQKHIRGIVYLLVATLLGSIAASAQLLPSYEFLSSSQFSEGFAANISSYFSYPLKHLITFIDPFALGNPMLGTYPHFLVFDGSVFWENIAYIGIVPLVLAAFALFELRNNRLVQFFALLIVAALILAWGAHSPLYFLYAIWPMTLFRVPARFVWLMVVGLVYLSSYTISKFQPKLSTHMRTLLIAGVFILHVIQLLHTWWGYHLIAPAERWLTPPTSTSYISKEGRMYTIGAIQAYARNFNKQGWQQEEPYHFLDEGIIPDSNILWGITHQGAKAGRYLRRPSLVDDFLLHEIPVELNNATMSATGHNLLNRFSVRTVLSFFPLTQTGLVEKHQETGSDMNLTVYDNPSALARVYVTHEATIAATLSQATQLLSLPAMPDNQVLLEQHEVDALPALKQFLMQPPAAPAPAPTVSLEKDTKEEVVLRVSPMNTPGILVLTDTNYHGWTAYVDGQKAPLLTANLSQRAVFLEKGEHTVTFRFESKSIAAGVRISMLTYAIITVLMVVPSHASTLRKWYSVLLPSPHRPRSRGTR